MGKIINNSLIIKTITEQNHSVLIAAIIGIVYHTGMKEKLRKVLASRQKIHITDSSRTPSAVLIPIFFKEGEYHLLFTQRTEKVKQHKGQISFPGGACEEEDKTHFDTALRECTEEIGMAIGVTELLGELDDFPTSTSNYIIYPFVGVVPWPYSFKADGREIKEIIEVPISALLNLKGHQETRVINGKEVTGYFYDYNGKVIWGATARILHQFLQVWTKAIATKLDND